MAPLPKGLCQLPGVRLITLDHFHYGRGSKFLLELALALDRDLSSLPSTLLLKLPSVALQNGSSTIMVFIANEILPWAHALGVPWSYYVPHHHEATALTGDGMIF